MKTRRVSAFALVLSAILIASFPGHAAEKSTKTLRAIPGGYPHSETCIRYHNPSDTNLMDANSSLAGCKTYNQRPTYGPGKFGPFCPSEMQPACQTKYGHVFAGGWEYLHGDSISYKKVPNMYLVNWYRTSIYIEAYSNMEQTFDVQATIFGGFAKLYGPHTRFCLEVYDWGETAIGTPLPDGTYRKDRYVNKTLAGEDCIYPEDPSRTTLQVTGSVGANHMMWIVPTAHHEQGDGAVSFYVPQIQHDIS